MTGSFAIRMARRVAVAAIALVAFFFAMSGSCDVRSANVAQDATGLWCYDPYLGWASCDDGYAISYGSGYDANPYAANPYSGTY